MRFNEEKLDGNPECKMAEDSKILQRSAMRSHLIIIPNSRIMKITYFLKFQFSFVFVLLSYKRTRKFCPIKIVDFLFCQRKSDTKGHT